MPSAASFGGGGILRNVDSTIVKVYFTDKNPLWTGPKPKPAKGAAKKEDSDFRSLFGVVEFLQDGTENPTVQPLFVGNADDFGITSDGLGLTGDKPISAKSDWAVFILSLLEDTTFTADSGGFPEGDVADYAKLVNARVRTSWRLNEEKTKRLGQKESKGKDGKVRKYNRENLIVTNFYGYAAGQATGKGTPAVAPSSNGNGASSVADAAYTQALEALSGAKDGKLHFRKIPVKALQAMAKAGIDAATREEVRKHLSTLENYAEMVGVVVSGEDISLEA